MYSYDSFEYFYEADMMEFLEQFGYLFLGLIIGFLLIALMVGLVFYILQAVGLYSIAKRRGLRNAWLAWIPVASYWIVGSISDQYQYVVKGKDTNRRKILLILSIATIVLSGVLNGIRTALMITGAEEVAFVNGALSAISGLAGSAMSITLLVFYYMSMYDLYSSVSPRNNVLFLVLSIIFHVTEPFFVFFNRKKDDGMPPRKPAP